MSGILEILLLLGVNFDGTIGVGSVISVSVMLVGFAASWYKMQARSESYEKDIALSASTTSELTRQVQLLSLTVERLSTLSEINEKKWERLSRDKD